MAQGLDALIHEPVVEPRPRHWKKYLADLDEIPHDPWDHAYRYQSPGPHGEAFNVESPGEDGRFGTRDDVTTGISEGAGGAAKEAP